MAHVAGQDHPQVSRQHHKVTAAAPVLIAVMLSGSHYLPDFPASRRLAPRLVVGALRRRERGDLEGAQYRLPVLVTQPSNLGNAGA